MKICFISSVFAKNYKEADKPRKFDTNKNYDYYLFTNLEPKNFTTSWNVIKLEEEYTNKYKKNVTKSRYPKFIGWKYIKNVMKKEYDVIFYCDAFYYPKKDIDWEKYGDMIINNEFGILQSKHVRNIFQECKTLINCRKDSKKNMEATMKFFQDNNTPNDCFMTENTAFGYNPNNKKITDTFIEFWNIYSEENLSHRDQPLWGYILWKYNIKPIIFDHLDSIKKEKRGKKRIINKLFSEDLSIRGFNGHKYV